jgi:hypothetical protein
LTPSEIDEIPINDVANRNPKTTHGIPKGNPLEKVNSTRKITVVEILETQIATQNQNLFVISKEYLPPPNWKKSRPVSPKKDSYASKP